MSSITRKFSDFFGLTAALDEPEADYRDDIARERDDYRPYRGESRYSDEYRGSYERDADRGYGRLDRDAHGRDRDLDDRYEPGHLRPLDRPVEREHVHITPREDFQDKYSEARDIAVRFRDGDIVTFDLVDLEPEQRKRYLDFAAGLAFALRGRIQAEGTVFTLLPDGVELADGEHDRMSV